MTTTVTRTAFCTVNWVRDETVDTGTPCQECSDMDAFIVVNVYVREYGECTRFVEACLSCGMRVASVERAAEVLVEIPASMRADVEGHLADITRRA